MTLKELNEKLEKFNEKNQNSNLQYYSFGLTTVLTIVFVVLKLTGTITWSWWWVFCPLWISIPFIIVTLILLIILVVGAVFVLLLKEARDMRKDEKSISIEGHITATENDNITNSDKSDSVSDIQE